MSSHRSVDAMGGMLIRQRMILSENRFPSPVEPGTGFFGIMRYAE
jgi:hypothetical protein